MLAHAWPLWGVGSVRLPGMTSLPPCFQLAALPGFAPREQLPTVSWGAAQLRWQLHMPVNVFHLVLSLLQNGVICSGAWPSAPGAPLPPPAQLFLCVLPAPPRPRPEAMWRS